MKGQCGGGGVEKGRPVAPSGPDFPSSVLLFYKSAKTVAPPRLRWHAEGSRSQLCCGAGTGLQGDGSERRVCAPWGRFSFLSSPLCGFLCLAIVLQQRWLLCDCSVLAGMGGLCSTLGIPLPLHLLENLNVCSSGKMFFPLSISPSLRDTLAQEIAIRWRGFMSKGHSAAGSTLVLIVPVGNLQL